VSAKDIVAGPWTSGVDSWSDAVSVSDNYTRWNVNVTTRGGCPRTRPGMSVIPVSTIGAARGMTVFTPNSGIAHLVVAIGTQILICPYPFTGPFVAIPTLNFGGQGQVYFTKAVQNTTQAADGTLTAIDPLLILMMCDGQTRSAYWDGTVARHLDPTKSPKGPNETPTFERMEWSGNRLWGSLGKRLRASDLGNPLKFTEENILAESGALTAPGDITAMTRTADFNNLIVYTYENMTKVQTNILDRTQWALTPGFQAEVFPGIGCAAAKSPNNQYGMTWWYSNYGLASLDQAIQTYRSSRMHAQDQSMSWSKTNLSPDISGICTGVFENYYIVSVPSGDRFNAHTWVMDQSWQQEQSISDYYASIRSPKWDGIWKGVRPVQIVTATIHGRQRCFCLSQDYPPTGSTQIQNNVWEMFTPARLDVGLDMNGNKVQKRISCSVETKVLAQGPEYKDFRYIEVYCADIEGVVDLTISYAPLRGGFKQVQTKHIVASQWSVVAGTTTIFVDTFNWMSYRPQSRVIRSQDDQGGNDAADINFEGVEATYPRQTDEGFSVLLQWTGNMSIRGVRLTVDDQIQEREGHVESDELTDRHVQMSGFQEIDSTTPSTVVDGLGLKSEFVSSNTRIWVDADYSSMS
jgi:hypothetical protein